MTEEKQELSVMDQLKEQLAQFSAQKEQAQSNLQQLIGAIYALDLAIKKLETITDDQVNE